MKEKTVLKIVLFNTCFNLILSRVEINLLKSLKLKFKTKKNIKLQLKMKILSMANLRQMKAIHA